MVPPKIGLGQSPVVGHNIRKFPDVSTMLFAASLAFGIAIACLFVLLSTPLRRLALDRPNERSMHLAPVPRIGGVAIAAGVAGSLAIAGSGGHALLWIALVLALVSFVDDLFGLGTFLRLAIHLAASGSVLALMVSRADPIVLLLLWLGIAWLTELFNFMDGSDGLAGGMAVVGFGACAIAAHIEGVVWLAIVCCAVAAAAFAFLLFNFAPAKVFMGDSGSIPLGFLAGAIGVAGWQAGVWELWFLLLVFSPFAVDATLTLGKRIWRREKFWQAHREHYYQRLVRMGFGHRNTALAEYVLMTICAGVALAARNAAPGVQMAVLGICAAGYFALAVWIDACWARRARDKPA